MIAYLETDCPDCIRCDHCVICGHSIPNAENHPRAPRSSAADRPCEGPSQLSPYWLSPERGPCVAPSLGGIAAKHAVRVAEHTDTSRQLTADALAAKEEKDRLPRWS